MDLSFYLDLLFYLFLVAFCAGLTCVIVRGVLAGPTRGKLVWGNLDIPDGKTGRWLLVFAALVWALVYLRQNLHPHAAGVPVPQPQAASAACRQP